MGKGTSSTTKTDTSTKVSTDTTTNIRDIGLTGANAVELAAILTQGAVASSISAKDILTRQTVQRAGPARKSVLYG